MTVEVKICGLKTLPALEAALEQRGDAETERLDQQRRRHQRRERRELGRARALRPDPERDEGRRRQPHGARDPGDDPEHHGGQGRDTNRLTAPVAAPQPETQRERDQEEAAEQVPFGEGDPGPEEQ